MGNNLIFFYQISAGTLLIIILYQLTKFEASRYDSIRDILITKFHSNHSKRGTASQREIIQIKNTGQLFLMPNPYMKFQTLT